MDAQKIVVQQLTVAQVESLIEQMKEGSKPEGIEVVMLAAGHRLPLAVVRLACSVPGAEINGHGFSAVSGLSGLGDMTLEQLDELWSRVEAENGFLFRVMSSMLSTSLGSQE
jgi:hypothetical protein